LGKNLRHRCPECGEVLNQATKGGKGYKCRTDGCDVHKVFIDGDRSIVRVVRSSVPKHSLWPVVQNLSDALLMHRGLLKP